MPRTLEIILRRSIAMDHPRWSSDQITAALREAAAGGEARTPSLSPTCSQPWEDKAMNDSDSSFGGVAGSNGNGFRNDAPQGADQWSKQRTPDAHLRPSLPEQPEGVPMATANCPGLLARRLYLPRMTDSGAEALAAALRSVGVDAHVLPPPDVRTLELGARHLTGEECLPAKVTLGDFLKVVETPGFDPNRTAFLMPKTEGPCRLGQYALCIRKVFRELGHPEVQLVSPTDSDGYRELGDLGPDLARTGWRGVVASDILRKLLLRIRPYECTPGDADTAYNISQQELCKTLESPGCRLKEQLARLIDTLVRIRDRFRTIPARYERGRLLIGIQGEIFCRMEEFSNDQLIRRLETCGGEAWLSDTSEWLWYSNSLEEQCLRHAGRGLSLRMLGAKLRDHIQHADEAALRAPFMEDFLGYEDPEDIDDVLQAGNPYLPQASTSGEMVISAGKVDYFFRKGVDGIIDISPFSCMNGIVSEALYPRQSQEHAGLPIKSFYFDGNGGHTTDDLEIFLELARAYQGRKPIPRRYPPCFG
jgi:predicted nucleotide-binding protein (sugar kinase/HSP70/actin superfamily)